MGGAGSGGSPLLSRVPRFSAWESEKEIDFLFLWGCGGRHLTRERNRGIALKLTSRLSTFAMCYTLRSLSRLDPMMALYIAQFHTFLIT